MSVNRLFETIYYLIEHKQTTAKELAEHFEVSTRTIYRDLDRLIVAGFPIYANQGAKGGIYIDSEFVLDKMTFSDDEQNQILMALQCIERLQDRDEAGLIDKMAALFNKNKLDWIEVDFTTWHHNNSQNEKFETIKKENGISQKYLAKTVKTPKKLKKYADKKGYVIGESVKYKKRTLCIMKKANEESLLKSKIYELNNGKIKRIFQFN